MRSFAALRESAEYRALLASSARLGADPLQVQGPGGNTSIKRGKAMWIKASGTWLADAETADIMVPVHAEQIRRAIETGDSRADDPAKFVAGEACATERLASIETPVHAVLPHPVVLHTHCVATIAVAVRANAKAVLAERLAGMHALFIPYVKPGARLAHAIHASLRPETRLIILGNHGLVACGDSVAEAEQLLREASERLEPERVSPGVATDPELATRLAGSGWMPVPHAETQAVARDPARLAIARGATLYPDHLVFLGPGVLVAPGGSDPAAAVARAPAPRALVVLEGEGVAIRQEASRPELALARCLGDVLARVEPGARVLRLEESEEHELMNWDAEKLRQMRNPSKGLSR